MAWIQAVQVGPVVSFVEVASGEGRKGGCLACRGRIARFSAGSGRRLVRYLRAASAAYSGMVTLTWPSWASPSGPEVKRCLRSLIERLRRRVAADGGGTLEQRGSEASGSLRSMCWFIEFTARGTPHIHAFVDFWIDRSWLARNWAEVCAVGEKGSVEFDAHVAAGTRIEKIASGRAGLVRYAAKYAAKQGQKVVPEGFGWVGRFWGIVGSREVVAATTAFPTASDAHPIVTAHVQHMRKRVDRWIADGKAFSRVRFGISCLFIRDDSAADEMLRLLRVIGKLVGGGCADCLHVQAQPDAEAQVYPA